MSVIRRYRRPLAWAIALLALIFLARVLLDSAAELQRYPLTVEPIALALSFVVLSVPLLLAVLLWLWGLRGLDGTLSLADGARIWFLSNTVRYVPGGIWQPVTMLVLAKERGVDEVRTAASVALNWILSNLSGLLVAGLYWTLDPTAPSRERLWLLPPFVLGALLALHPAVLGSMLRLALRAAGRAPLENNLGFGRLLGLLLGHCAVWVGYGIAFASFWSALYPLDWRELPRLTGVFAGAYAIGFLSLLTPSGLGVREGALVFFLSGVYPLAVVTVVALLSRLWLIAGELLCTALVLVMTRGRQSTHPVSALRVQVSAVTAPVAAGAGMLSRFPALVVALLIAAYVVVFSALGIRQHDALLTHKEDLGQIDQAVWNSLHGRWLVETDEDHQSTRLTDHAEPVLVLSSLVFLLWDDVRALLIWQALLLALGAWAIFLLARDVLGRVVWLPVFFALSYLLFPALEAAHLAEFHAAPLAAAPIAFALLFLQRRQWRRFVLAALLVAAVKEEMALVGVMLGLAGLIVALRDSRPRTLRSLILAPSAGFAGGIPSSFILLTSLLWFSLATFVIIPHVGAAKYAGADSIYFQRYGELGATPAAVVRTLFANPLLVLRIVSEPARLGYLGGMLASVGFLALLAPGVLLVGAPLLGANLLSNFAAQYSGDFHYSAPLAPIFVAAAIYGLRRVRRRSPAPWLTGVDRVATRFPLSALGRGVRGEGSSLYLQTALCMTFVLVSALLYHRVRGYTPLSENFYWPNVSAHAQRFDRFASQIPRAARLSATPPLFPHLSHREFIYVFPVVADAEYVLLDAAGVTDMHPNDFRNAVNGLLAGGQFGVLDSADGYILLKRGAVRRTLPDAFYDVFRAQVPAQAAGTGARPQVTVDIIFGDAVRLLGYDLLPEPRWHTVRVRYYWQALRPLEDDLRLYPFYHDASGKVIEDPIQRPLVASIWYPPSRWRVGEIIQTETLPWDVGDTFMLAAGVVHGSDWDRRGRRLATPNGETQLELGAFDWHGKSLVRR